MDQSWWRIEEGSWLGRDGRGGLRRDVSVGGLQPGCGRFYHLSGGRRECGRLAARTARMI